MGSRIICALNRFMTMSLPFCGGLCGILFLIGIPTISSGQQPTFDYTDIVAAKQTADKSGKPILAFFSYEGMPQHRQLAELFADPEIREALRDFETVYVDMKLYADVARALHIFKAGTIVLYSRFGQALVTLSSPLPKPELLTWLRTHRTSIAPRNYRKGERVCGPVRAPLISPAEMTLGTLDHGTTYVLVIEGTGSVWPRRKDGVDGMYIYQSPTPSRLRPYRLVRVNGKRIYELAKETMGHIPPYNPEHVYEILIPGAGSPLTVSLKDIDAAAQADNSGQFTLSVYNLIQ